MIAESLLGVEELIARFPPLLSRLRTPPFANFELMKAERFAYDYYEAGDDQEPARPYFILQEYGTQYSTVNLDQMQGISAVDVTYSEETHEPTDHKVSKLYFVDFVESILEWIDQNQGKNVSGQSQAVFITIYRIEMIQQAIRSKKSRHDADRSSTDYFWCRWRMWVGEPEAV